jgi:hypothetical protein
MQYMPPTSKAMPAMLMSFTGVPNASAEISAAQMKVLATRIAVYAMRR